MVVTKSYKAFTTGNGFVQRAEDKVSLDINELRKWKTLSNTLFPLCVRNK